MATLLKLKRVPPLCLSIPLYLPKREFPTDRGTLLSLIHQHGVLDPLVVRQASPDANDQYVVIDGRERLEAVYELQRQGKAEKVKWVPIAVVDSNGVVDDLRIHLALNSTHSPYTHGEIERICVLIRQHEVVTERQIQG